MSRAAIQTPIEVCAGAMLGPYRILECIGDGGMGRVYRAEHVDLGRPVAIKFLLPHFAAHPEAVSRFLQEARAVNMVRHANLVDIYDVFVDEERGVRACVMELLTGQSLRDVMMREALDVRTTLSIVHQVAGALHAVHGAGIVHRDLKPENIHISRGADGALVAKVLDFGVAKFTRGDAPYRTGAGIVVGSPWYMAPEQAREQPVDARSDVYSLGVLLYEMLTGCVPFTGESFAMVIQGHLHNPAPPMRRRDGWEPPAAISAAVMRCLEKDPAARPRDMAEAWAMLTRAAGSSLSRSSALVPALSIGASPGVANAVSTPPPAEPKAVRRLAPARLSTRRLATLSFAAGFAVVSAMLAAFDAPSSAAQPLSRPAPAAAAQAPSPRSRGPLAASPARSAAPPPAPAVAPAPKPALAARVETPRREKATPRSKRHAGSKGRWSKAAFQAKRARAHLASIK